MKLFYTFEFYSRLLVSAITKGFKDRPDNALMEDEYYYSINRIYTKNKVKKMYFIHELPKHIDAGFLHDLKRVVSDTSLQLNSTYNTNLKCELVDVMISEPYDLNFSTFKNRSKLNMWKRRYENAMRESGHLNSVEELTAEASVLDTRDKNQWMIESWMYIKNVKDVEKGEFCRTNIMLELIADSDDILNYCENAIKDYLYSREIVIKEVFLQSNEYNKAFTPAGSEYGKSLLSKMNPPSILSDNLVNSFDVPTHGRVGDDTGICFGTDIYSAMPIFYDLGKGSDAINILLSASTGEGKSNYMKGIFSSFDIMGYSSIILDYEGDECATRSLVKN